MTLLAAHTLFMEGAYLQGPVLAAALVALGVGVGVLTGLFGVGGGFLIVPLLVSLLNIDPTLAVGSGFSTIIGASAAGVRRHSRIGNVHVSAIAAVGVGSVVGTLLGRMVHLWLREDMAKGNEIGFQTLILVIYLVLLAGTIALVLRPTRADGKTPGLLERLPLPPRIDIPAAGLFHVSLPGMVLVGVAVGVLTGLLGIGGGVLMMPILISVVGFDPKSAVGSSLGIVLLAATVGAITFGLDGQVNLWIVFSLLAGTTVGVQVGSALCHTLHGERLKRYFALVVAGAMVIVAVKLASLLAGGS